MLLVNENSTSSRAAQSLSILNITENTLNKNPRAIQTTSNVQPSWAFIAIKYALIGAITIDIGLNISDFFRAAEKAEQMLESPLYSRYNTKDRKYYVSLIEFVLAD